MSDLAAEWRVWVASNLIRGRERAEIAAELVAAGLDPIAAEREIGEIAASPGVIAALETLRPVQLAQRLRRAHLRLGGRAIPVRAGLDRASFLDQHVATQVPVLLPDVTAGWAARDWTWEGLVARFGDVVVEVSERRTGAAHPDRDTKKHAVMRPFREVVARVLDPSTGNDLYVVAPNKALEGPLSGMLADVGPAPAFFDPERLAVSSAWIGPTGARTPLHHDTSDIVLCQILGRKRILLAPPEEVAIADHSAGFWADVDLADPASLAATDLAGAAIREAVVHPGESLLVPSGWWHQVVSLDPSLSLTFAGLWHENAFPWYRAGNPA